MLFSFFLVVVWPGWLLFFQGGNRAVSREGSRKSIEHRTARNRKAASRQKVSRVRHRRQQGTSNKHKREPLMIANRKREDVADDSVTFFIEHRVVSWFSRNFLVTLGLLFTTHGVAYFSPATTSTFQLNCFHPRFIFQVIAL